jgi:hypothetical protein
MSGHDVIIGLRFLCRLPSFLRHPVSIAEARVTLRQRLERREADFLTIAKRAIYEHSGSPYRQLLKLAGCEYGDLERLVSKDGVEEALRTLYRHGVYISVDEFKGRRPVIREGMTVALDPNQFRNPLSAHHVPARTSGSRGAGSLVLMDLAFIRDRAVNTSLVLDAWGGAKWLHADWGVPGAAALAYVLEFSSFGAPPVRWFSLVDPAAPGLHPRYRWSGHVMRWGSFLAGVPLPRPQYVPLDEPLPIARWMEEVLRTGRTPILHTFTSSAVRLCLAALDAGIDLRGAQFMLSGEPTTAARLRVVGLTGAEALSRYSSTECGPIGYGCLAPEAPDDLHLLHDLHALIQAAPGEAVSKLSAPALLISSLRSTAPFILLNVSLGDQAVVLPRACGCPLERLGWATHLHTIRSYEKLTGGGMTFLDTDVIRVLEEVLPARFGGAPTDYQLVEEEAADGQPRLRLLVHPAVGPLDPIEVVNAFLAAISAGSGAERVMGLLWREAGLLRVERLAPRMTASGKILHLHLEHMPRATPASRPEA